MADALATADPQAQRLLVTGLLEREHEAARVGLVRHFDRLSEDLQQMVVDHAGELDGAIRRATDDPEINARLNAVKLVVKARSFRLSYVLASQMHAPDAMLQKAAGAGLVGLGRQILDPPQDLDQNVPEHRTAQRVRWLAAAIHEACACFHQHKRAEAVEAAACLAPRRPGRLIHLLLDRRSAAHAALVELIRRGDSPLINRAMLFFAGFEELRAVVIQRLTQVGIYRQLELLLSSAHLLAAPVVRTTIRKMPEPLHLVPDQACVAKLSYSQLRAAPRWIRTLHLGTSEQVQALGWLLAHEDRLTRLLALRALTALRASAADDLVATACHDAELQIARIALRHLLYRNWPGLSQLIPRLLASPHADVRQVAESQLVRFGFQRYWMAWDQMDAASRASAGKALMKIDPQFHRMLAERLNDRNPQVRFKAVMMLRTLGQAAYFESELTRGLADPDPMVASAVASALGETGEPSKATARLIDALDHNDDRVRANAVESLERLAAVEPAAPKLSVMCRASGSGNRSRANAIKALLRLPMRDAVAALSRMLDDPNPRHRTSALWVVERTMPLSVGRQVAIMAQTDPDPRVRGRALRVFRKLAQASSTATMAGDKVAAQAAAVLAENVTQQERS